MNKCILLKNKYEGFITQMQQHLSRLKYHRVINQSEIDSILNIDSNYAPRPNRIVSEVKAIYHTIRESLRIISETIAQDAININAPLLDTDAFNNDLVNTTILLLKQNKASCKSFLEFMSHVVYMINHTDDGNEITYTNIKISNDRDYYFFCDS